MASISLSKLDKLLLGVAWRRLTFNPTQISGLTKLLASWFAASGECFLPGGGCAKICATEWYTAQLGCRRLYLLGGRQLLSLDPIAAIVIPRKKETKDAVIAVSPFGTLESHKKNGSKPRTRITPVRSAAERTQRRAYNGVLHK